MIKHEQEWSIRGKGRTLKITVDSWSTSWKVGLLFKLELLMVFTICREEFIGFSACVRWL